MARGQPPFIPTDEQRKMVEIMVGLGVPQVEICQLILHNRRPISHVTLERKFRREIDQGTPKLKARMAGFLVATIEGRDFGGCKPITNDAARAQCLHLFMKARMGWSEKTILEHQGKDGAALPSYEILVLPDNGRDPAVMEKRRKPNGHAEAET